jgi:phosphoribosyl-ATP pyrophosphohydrolase/phosphoribosyl-AMP cyclohydrolase
MTESDIISFDDDGLIPAVVQDAETRDVLLLAWMNRESLDRTLATGRATFWSRSRDEIWEKGATSGNVLHLERVYKNCEANSLLVLVHPTGPACHTGNTSCYYRELDPAADIPGS